MKSLKGQLVTIYGSISVIIIIILSLVGIFSSQSGMENLASETLKKKLVSDVRVGKELLFDEYGELSLNESVIYAADGRAVNESHDFIEHLGKSFDDVATIFAKEGNDFIRITTNIRDKNDKRAINTYLGSDSAAYPSMVAGETFVGNATILGVQHLSIYEPIFDSKGNMIGIFFLGISQENVKNLMSEEARNLVSTLSIVSIILLLIVIFITIVVATTITRPLIRAVDNMKQLAEYDLTMQISSKDRKRKDEVGVLANAIASIQSKLKDLVGSMQVVSDNVETSSSNLATSSFESRTASEEIAKTVEDIASGANNQAEETTHGADKLSRLGSVIEEDRNYLEELTKSSQGVNVLVDNGLDIIEILNQKTEENGQRAEEAYKSIIKTDGSSEKISEASQLISSIAAQTNLLALNAAIEAARAGEHGKGFAVVADEIRKLSEQSTASTKIIDQMVGVLKEDAKEAVTLMEASQHIVNDQSDKVKEMTDKYQEIMKAIQGTENVVSKLEQSSHQMEKEKNTVSGIIEDLSAIAEENAAATQEASAAMEEQLATVEEIAGTSSHLSGLAKELNELVTTFRTK